jgi:predicted transcriptional regulator
LRPFYIAVAAIDNRRERKRLGLNQRQDADFMGVTHGPGVSQIENGDLDANEAAT